MKKQTIIILVLILVKIAPVFGQPINYFYNDKRVSKEYIISGKSKIKIVNCDEISQMIKENNLFSEFCKSYKDSLSIESVSSLIVFRVNNNMVKNTNSTNSDFILNNVVNDIINSSFKNLRFKRLNSGENLIGVYLHHIPKSKKVIVEFVEFKDGNYYSILKKKYNI
jgi:hypothetical protein